MANREWTINNNIIKDGLALHLSLVLLQQFFLLSLYPTLLCARCSPHSLPSVVQTIPFIYLFIDLQTSLRECQSVCQKVNNQPRRHFRSQRQQHPNLQAKQEVSRRTFHSIKTPQQLLPVKGIPKVLHHASRTSSHRGRPSLC